MDRRTFVKASAWASAAACLQPRLAAAFERRGTTIVLVDAALPASRAFADAAARRAMPVVDIGGDVGAFWHAALAPHLACTHALVAGVLRHSDFFVLSRLVSCAECAAQYQAICGETGAQTVTFLIDHSAFRGRLEGARSSEQGRG
jgi:hypothetical protein